LEAQNVSARFTYRWCKSAALCANSFWLWRVGFEAPFHFLRIGSFLERADNTARMLDVKFHDVESDFYGNADERDNEYEFYHWSAILRSVSGFEVYRKAYRNVIRPEKVAELLILRPDMPRSLAHCHQPLCGVVMTSGARLGSPPAISVTTLKACAVVRSTWATRVTSARCCACV
jgi:hypothetical protein